MGAPELQKKPDPEEQGNNFARKIRWDYLLRPVAVFAGVNILVAGISVGSYALGSTMLKKTDAEFKANVEATIDKKLEADIKHFASGMNGILDGISSDCDWNEKRNDYDCSWNERNRAVNLAAKADDMARLSGELKEYLAQKPSALQEYGAQHARLKEYRSKKRDWEGIRDSGVMVGGMWFFSVGMGYLLYLDSSRKRKQSEKA